MFWKRLHSYRFWRTHHDKGWRVKWLLGPERMRRFRLWRTFWRIRTATTPSSS